MFVSKLDLTLTGLLELPHEIKLQDCCPHDNRHNDVQYLLDITTALVPIQLVVTSRCHYIDTMTPATPLLLHRKMAMKKSILGQIIWKYVQYACLGLWHLIHPLFACRKLRKKLTIPRKTSPLWRCAYPCFAVVWLSWYAICAADPLCRVFWCASDWSSLDTWLAKPFGNICSQLVKGRGPFCLMPLTHLSITRSRSAVSSGQFPYIQRTNCSAKCMKWSDCHVCFVRCTQRSCRPDLLWCSHRVNDNPRAVSQFSLSSRRASLPLYLADF